jgi:hypothetical protein
VITTLNLRARVDLTAIDRYAKCIYNTGMGTIFRIKNKYAVKIIPGDHSPPHIHIIGGGGEVKIAIDDLHCYYVRGFTERQVSMFLEFLKDRKQELMEAWNETNE